MAEIKLCAFCEHFKYSKPGIYHYSSYTSDVYGGAECKKGVFWSSGNFSDEYDIRSMLKNAENCEHYKPVKD